MKYNLEIDMMINNSITLILLNIRPGSRVLEFGPATGYMTRYMKEKLGCTIYCVEVDEQAANIAKKYCEEMIVADLDNLEWSNKLDGQVFDYLVCSDVLEHLKDPWTVLKQATGFLKKNGIVLTSLPNVGHVSVIMELIKGKFDYRSLGLLDSSHVRFFTGKSVLELLDRAGLSPVKWLASTVLPEHTEFKQPINALPWYIQKYLKSKPDANVYQFVTVSKRKEDIVDIEERFIDFSIDDELYKSKYFLQVFWDKNDSFSEDTSVKVPLKYEQDICEYDIPLPLEANNCQFRLDPGNCHAYVEIVSIILCSVETDGRRIQLAHWSKNNYFKGITLGNNTLPLGSGETYKFLCMGEDPQFYLENVNIVENINKPLALTVLMRISEGFIDNMFFELVHSRSEIKAKEKEIEEYGLQVAQMGSEIKVKDEEIEGYRSQVAQIQTEIKIRDMEQKNYISRIETLELEIANKNVKLSEGLKNLKEKENQLKDILNTKTWRWSKPIRQLYSCLGLRLIQHNKKKKNLRLGIGFPDFLNGNLENRDFQTCSQGDLIPIGGWLFSIGPSIIQLTATDGISHYPLKTGLTRKDVQEAHPSVEHAISSGFEGHVPISKRRGKIKIDIIAHLDDGRELVCFSRKGNVVVNRVDWFSIFKLAMSKGLIAIKYRRLPKSPKRWLNALCECYYAVNGKTEIGKFQNFHQHEWENKDFYDRWILNNNLTENLLRLIQQESEKLSKIGPKISIVVPVFNPELSYLEKMLDSVKKQTYPNWELCIADDVSNNEVKNILHRAAEEDERVKVTFRMENGHIVKATNSALDLASGEYVALLDHDDELSPDALLHVAECIINNPEVDWVYTDEDKVDAQGHRFDPQFKGSWNPEMAITHNYTHHLAVIRRSLVEKAGRMREGYEGAQDLDLFLRVAELTSSDKVYHVPHICYHWRAHAGSTANHGRQKSYIFDSAKKAIADALNRRGLNAKPFLPKFAQENDLCLNQLNWDNTLLTESLVTIVIPTHNRVDLLKKCILSLENTVRPNSVILLIVDDQSNEEKTLDYLRELPKNCKFPIDIIRPNRGDGKFNYARLMNEAVKHVHTELVLFLNNDIEAIESGWLEDMVGWLSIPGVGAVGARLLFPDKTIQHAGVVIGPHNGLADHQFINLGLKDLGYLFLPHAARNVSAVTGACLLTSTKIYKDLGGFDKDKFAVAYNDVDYCLRLWNAGWRVVYTPQATLYHITSASRGLDFDSQEHANFIKKYRDYKDPFINLNLDINSMNMAINPIYVGKSNRVRKIKVLVLTHNLNLEGAPIVAFEIAAHFSKAGHCVEILSLSDGPLKERCLEKGLPVRIASKEFNSLNVDNEEFDNHLNNINNSFDVSSFNLIICNTILNYWGVKFGNLHQIPTVWNIHESFDLEEFNRQCSSFVANSINQCFMEATRIIFQAEATRKLYHHRDEKARFRVIPGGLPLDRIDSFRRKHDKLTLREKYQLPLKDKIVSIIGTTCERKGQHHFVDAVQYLREKYPEITEDVTFLIVGGRSSSYLEYLNSKISNNPCNKIQLIMETPDIYDFYHLSDIFVCASHQESFPMVVLLAMAFEIGIVSTDVFGIPEIIAQGIEGILFKPGDSKMLAENLMLLLSDHEKAEKLASNARHKVERCFDNNILLNKYIDICKEAIVCYK
ncbi:MAG TPA: hypothetical protein DEF34_07755 [Desulfotomaculum sp.]|nr:hypothetical protein [Desulfotomaculum sp.]